MKFEKIAPYLQDPLVLVGLVLFLFFGIGRLLLQSGIIPPLPAGLAYSLVRRLLTYGFILALLVAVVGFSIKYRELSEQEQKAAVRLLKQELQGNINVIGELKKNIETILKNVGIVHKVLRHPGIRLSAVLFPSENTDPQADVPASVEYARQRMLIAKKQGLLDDALEKEKFRRAGKAIAGTIDRTESTIVSFADFEGSRYQISTKVWTAHLPILRKVDVIDVTKLQSLYQEMERLRTNYTVTVEHSVKYLNVVRDYFANSDDAHTKERLAEVLAAERIFVITIVKYGRIVVDKLERIIKIRHELDEPSVR